MDVIWLDGELVVAGPDTGPFVGPAVTDAAVGLRFLPGALPTYLRVPAVQLRDQRVACTELVGRREAEQIGAALVASPSPGRVLEEWAGRRSESVRIDPRAVTVVEALRAGCSVADTAARVGVSTRHLGRLRVAAHRIPPPAPGPRLPLSAGSTAGEERDPTRVGRDAVRVCRPGASGTRCATAGGDDRDPPAEVRSVQDILADGGETGAVSFESRHVSTFIQADPATVYDYVRNPALLPEWAAGLAAGVRCEDGRWIAESPFGVVEVRFAPPTASGCLTMTWSCRTGR